MDNMMVMFLACYFLMMGFILLYFFVEFKDYKKYSRGINNIIYSKDQLRVTYVYSIPHAKERVVEILRLKNAQDRLPYEFDEKAMEIGFKDSQGEFQHRAFAHRYRMHFEPKEDSCLLYLEQINISFSRTDVPMFMNAFWSIKVDAVPYEVRK